MSSSYLVVAGRCSNLFLSLSLFLSFSAASWLSFEKTVSLWASGCHFGSCWVSMLLAVVNAGCQHWRSAPLTALLSAGLKELCSRSIIFMHMLSIFVIVIVIVVVVVAVIIVIVVLVCRACPPPCSRCHHPRCGVFVEGFICVFLCNLARRLFYGGKLQRSNFRSWSTLEKCRHNSCSLYYYGPRVGQAILQKIIIIINQF